MSDGKPAFLNDELSKKTTIFGLRLWVVVGILVGAAIVILLFLISLWFISRRNRKSSPLSLPHKNSTIPTISREIQEIRVDPTRNHDADPPGSDPAPEEIHIEIGKGPHKAGHGSGGDAAAAGGGGPEVSHLGWGHWYTLRELEDATNEFADENVIGEGGYGIVYMGVLEGDHKVAVKNLLNNRFIFFSHFELI